MLVQVFERSGALLTAASSPGEAMEAMGRATPDLLVCDIGPAGEDGLELIRQVRALEAEKGGRIPALALTAHAGRTQLEKALEAGVDRLPRSPWRPRS